MNVMGVISGDRRYVRVSPAPNFTSITDVQTFNFVTGDTGNGIPKTMDSQAHWIYNIKSGCNFCHELGTQITRTLGHMDHLGFKTPEEAWVYRTQLGVRGSAMAGSSWPRNSTL